MKHLKRFNESMENQIYQQVFDSIKDCFQEFEDNGWEWSTSSYRDNLSYHPMPHFKYIMTDREEDEYINSSSIKRFEFTGSINSNGEILWETKKGIKSFEKSEDFQDFIVAIKRIQEEIGLGFGFSYNNLGGDKRIIIQGKI